MNYRSLISAAACLAATCSVSGAQADAPLPLPTNNITAAFHNTSLNSALSLVMMLAHKSFAITANVPPGITVSDQFDHVPILQVLDTLVSDCTIPITYRRDDSGVYQFLPRIQNAPPRQAPGQGPGGRGPGGPGYPGGPAVNPNGGPGPGYPGGPGQNPNGGPGQNPNGGPGQNPNGGPGQMPNMPQPNPNSDSTSVGQNAYGATTASDANGNPQYLRPNRPHKAN